MDSLKVKDINNYRIFKTKREVNPLEPVYTVGAEEKG